MSGSGYTKFKSPRQYADYKIKLLRKDFCISITHDEIVKLHSLDSEMAIDRYCEKIILDHWEEE